MRLYLTMYIYTQSYVKVHLIEIPQSASLPYPKAM